MKFFFLSVALLLSTNSAFAVDLEDLSWQELRNSNRYKVEDVRISFRGQGTQKSIFAVCDDNGVLDGGISYVCDEYSSGRDARCVRYRPVENRLPFSTPTYVRLIGVHKLVFDTPTEFLGRKRYEVPACN